VLRAGDPVELVSICAHHQDCRTTGHNGRQHAVATGSPRICGPNQTPQCRACARDQIGLAQLSLAIDPCGPSRIGWRAEECVRMGAHLECIIAYAVQQRLVKSNPSGCSHAKTS
jgi:hypothetical protein